MDRARCYTICRDAGQNRKLIVDIAKMIQCPVYATQKLTTVGYRNDAKETVVDIDRDGERSWWGFLFGSERHNTVRADPNGNFKTGASPKHTHTIFHYSNKR